MNPAFINRISNQSLAFCSNATEYNNVQAQFAIVWLYCKESVAVEFVSNHVQQSKIQAPRIVVQERKVPRRIDKKDDADNMNMNASMDEFAIRIESAVTWKS